MFNLFPRPQSNNNSTSDDEPSSIDFDFKASINIKGKGKVWVSLIPWLLSGSIVAESITYGVTKDHILPDTNVEESVSNQH